MTFDHAFHLFQRDRINELSADAFGRRFLKLRSLSRKEHLEQLFLRAGLVTDATAASALFREAYDSNIAEDRIDAVIAAIYEEEIAAFRERETELVSELYKLEVFDWGGLHQNSLEKTIVDNYVKKITSYGLLEDKIENELHHSLRGFALCQWYNHWTSIIIENIFKAHHAVIPAVGLVKKIDFFIHDVPFDLKVTYLPEGFVADMRRGATLKPELTLMKQAARRNDVHFDAELSPAKLLEDLWKKLRDHPSPDAQAVIAALNTHRLSLIHDCRNDPLPLIRWLYENQGIRRFDSSNRLFLVLIDQTNYFQSWKLKRAKPLLSAGIGAYLDNVPPTPGREIQFAWEGVQYACRSDVVFVLPPTAEV
jgi:hypothetical protein